MSAHRPGETGSDVAADGLHDFRLPDAFEAPAQPIVAASRPRAPLRIALVAGESSGDLLGAGLLSRLRERHPDALFAGVGGDAMRAEGLAAWHDASELAVMGLSEVLAHLPRLLKLRYALRRRVLDWKPDVFVGIDAPDFNLGLERALRRRGVHTVHYVSPSIWAWRQGRAAKIGRSAERVLCLFPMEPPIYARHGVDATFVGHPLADLMPLNPDRRGARQAFGIDDDADVLAVLPGSRLGEIARLGKDFVEAARLVAEARPGLQVLVPAANRACREALDALLYDSPHPTHRIRVIDGDARAAMVASDVVLLASGTATLEAMLAKRAMVVGYRIAPSTYRIVKGLGLLKVDRYALPNVLAGADVVPELMQDDCTPEKLAAAVLAWFEDESALRAIEPVFRELHITLRRDASSRAADAVESLAGVAP